MSEDYLQEGFDYMNLKVSELRRILQENNIAYPQSGKKARLRAIYEDKLIPMIPEIIQRRENDLSTTPTPKKRKRSELETNDQKEENDSNSSVSSSSSSQHETNSIVKRTVTSFTDDDDDESMSSKDSLRNVVVPQKISTPVSKKRKTTDNSRSSTGTPIANKVQKKNLSYTAGHRADISSLPLLSSDDNEDNDNSKDDSISANITNHGKQNQQTPVFDFSVQRRTLSPDLNKLKVSSGFAERLIFAKNYTNDHNNDDNDDGEVSKSNEPMKVTDTLNIRSGKPTFQLQPSIEISDSSGSDSDDNKPETKSPSYNKSLENQGITDKGVEPNVDDNIENSYNDKFQQLEHERDEFKEELEDYNEEREELEEELEEQREKSELDEEDEVAELDNEVEHQQEEQQNLALELDDELDDESEKDANNTEYEKLHQRPDEELQKENSKKITIPIDQKDIEVDNMKIKSVTSKTRNTSVSFAARFSKFLFNLVLFAISLIVLSIPILLGLWYREQRVTVGYCGYERQCQTLLDIYPSVEQLSYIDDLLKEYTPKCIPCPENSICYPYLKLRCRPGYTLQKSKLSLFGLIPMSDSCVKDDKREQIVREMVQKSLEFLRTKNAEISCGENENDIESGISQIDLYNIFSESRAPWIDNEEYEKLWEEALQNLENEPEIIMRQVSINAFFIKIYKQ